MTYAAYSSGGAGLTLADCAAYWPSLALDVLHGSYLGPVRDQGRRGTCLAFATSAAHSAVRGEVDDMCVEWLFWGAKKRDGMPDDGTTRGAIMEALALDGQPYERAWPYDERRAHLDPTYNPPPLKGSPCFTRTSRPDRNSLAQVIAILDAGSALVLGLNLTPGFHNATYTDGRISELAARGPVVAGHALLAVGHGTDSADGERHFVIRNSWGSGWGRDGYALVAGGYLRQHMTGTFTLR